MRFMVLVKADEDSEAGVMPSEELLAAMGKYNEELVAAGVMLAGEGLLPSSRGTRVRFSGTQRTVTDGPFIETKELIAGFWLWQCESMGEAIEWLKRAPFDGGTEIEIRPVFEAEDFGEAFTPELRAQEERLRAQAEQLDKGAGKPSPHVQPYLFFGGCCEQAIEFYRSALGAEVTTLMRFKDSPEPPPSDTLPPGFEDKVMHAELRIGDTTVMVSDGCCTGSPGFQGVSLSLAVPDDAETERLFNALADNGQVQMPLARTFFSSRFGMVADRFGVSWMIVVTP